MRQPLPVCCCSMLYKGGGAPEVWSCSALRQIALAMYAAAEALSPGLTIWTKRTMCNLWGLSLNNALYCQLNSSWSCSTSFYEVMMQLLSVMFSD